MVGIYVRTRLYGFVTKLLILFPREISFAFKQNATKIVVRNRPKWLHTEATYPVLAEYRRRV